MSKIKEQIIKSIDLQNQSFVDKDDVTQSFEPKNAYLLPNEDGTHERYVTDDNNVISKQEDGGNLTLEQARQNGNVLEGDVETYGSETLIYNISNDKRGSLGLFEGVPFLTASNNEDLNNIQTDLVVQTTGVGVIAQSPNIKGILGNFEFNKQSDRLAFSQLSDVYDANSYSTEETKIGGTWIDGKPIYRKVSNIAIPTVNPEYIDLSVYFPNIKTLIKATPIIDFTNDDGRKMFGNTLETYCISFDFNDNYIGMYCRNFDLTANEKLGVADSIIVILEYTKTTN